jgi:curved DNA-binding protein CbpA
MPETKDYKGLGPSSAVVKLIAGADLSKAQLSAQEGFVLSRIDGSTLGMLCMISGLGEQPTVAILKRLRELGLVQIGDLQIGDPQAAPPAGQAGSSRGAETPARKPTPSRGASSLRGGQRSTREIEHRSTPVRGTAARENPNGSSPSVAHDARRPTPSGGTPSVAGRTTTPARGTGETRVPTPERGTGETRVPTPPRGSGKTKTTPVRGVDPARALMPDEPGIDLSSEVRASIRAFFGMLQDMNFFELLDVEPYVDGTTLKRAYFKRSKEFHPDRYFNKNLGPYKDMLQEIFKQVSAAYKFLDDDQQREAYRQMVVQDLEQQSLLRQVEEQGATALREEAEQARVETRDVAERLVEEPQLAPEHILPQREVHSDDLRRERSDESRRERRERREDLTGPIHIPVPPPVRRTDDSGSYRRLTETEEKERDERREEDRRRRRQMLVKPVMGRLKRAQMFYEQGMRQLSEGQNMAAAASLNLAVSFCPDDPRYRAACEEASGKSRSGTAETYFKRGLFEESVGRMDAAGKQFIRAADAHPKTTYCQRAAEYLLALQDLIKAKEYATKAVQADESSVEARIILAKVYEAAGMTKNARRELQAALKIDPKSSDAKDLMKSLRGG